MKEKTNKIDMIVEKFGNKDGSDLEKESLELLGITKEDKKLYFGNPVEVVITKS